MPTDELHKLYGIMAMEVSKREAKNANVHTRESQANLFSKKETARGVDDRTMNTRWAVVPAVKDTTIEGKVMRVLSLTQNKFATVDDEDYENLIQYKWHAVHLGEQWYAATKQHSQSGVRILMHRFILGLKPGEGEVDHINGNGLDNRRSNIRLVTRSENQRNRGKITGTYTSKHKGVAFNKGRNGRRDRWVAYINIEGRHIHLGSFQSEKDAIAAREKAE